jgi:hypothetical protein
MGLAKEGSQRVVEGRDIQGSMGWPSTPSLLPREPWHYGKLTTCQIGFSPDFAQIRVREWCRAAHKSRMQPDYKSLKPRFSAGLRCSRVLDTNAHAT